MSNLMKVFLSALLFLGAAVANAATVIVTPTDTQGWFEKGGTTGTGSLSATSPAGNPLAPGALELVLDGSAGQIAQAARIPLITVGNITAISWSSASNSNQLPTAKVEYFGSGRSGTLVPVIPVYPGDSTWRTYDGTALSWWSTEFGGGDVRSWAAWQADVGGILMNYFVVGVGSTGGAVPATTAYIDDVTLNGTTWNFEQSGSLPPQPSAPVAAPTMSVWGLGMLIALLGVVGFIRRRKML